MIHKKTSIVIILCMVFFLVSCGEKAAEQTTETEVVAEQTVLGEKVGIVEDLEEKVEIVEETAVVEIGSTTVDVDTEETKYETIEMKIENYAFEEKTLTVQAGTTIVWENYDSAPHTVTGDGLDSGKMSKGDTYEYTFTKLGTYEYICTYHPSMTAQVIVE